MAMVCVVCGKRKGILDYNYSGFDVRKHGNHQFPERISPEALPGSHHSDYLCADCASKSIITCAIHGVISKVRFSLGKSPWCEHCIEEHRVANSTSFPFLMDVLSGNQHGEVKNSAVLRLDAINKAPGAFGPTEGMPVTKIVELCLPFLAKNAAEVQKAMIRLLTHSIAVRLSDSYWDVSSTIFNIASSDRFSDELRRCAVDNLLEFVGVNAMTSFAQAENPNPSHEEILLKLMTYWRSHVKHHGSVFNEDVTGQFDATEYEQDISLWFRWFLRYHMEILGKDYDGMGKGGYHYVPMLKFVGTEDVARTLLDPLAQWVCLKPESRSDEIGFTLDVIAPFANSHVLTDRVIIAMRISKDNAEKLTKTMASDPLEGIRRVVDGVVCVECPKCGTDFNRRRVIDLIREQSPFIFEFENWSTGFVCQACRANIAISKCADD